MILLFYIFCLITVLNYFMPKSTAAAIVIIDAVPVTFAVTTICTVGAAATALTADVAAVTTVTAAAPTSSVLSAPHAPHLQKTQ